MARRVSSRASFAVPYHAAVSACLASMLCSSFGLPVTDAARWAIWVVSPFTFEIGFHLESGFTSSILESAMNTLKIPISAALLVFVLVFSEYCARTNHSQHRRLC